MKISGQLHVPAALSLRKGVNAVKGNSVSSEMHIRHRNMGESDVLADWMAFGKRNT